MQFESLQYINKYRYIYHINLNIDILCKKDKYRNDSYVEIRNILLQKYALY